MGLAPDPLSDLGTTGRLSTCREGGRGIPRYTEVLHSEKAEDYVYLIKRESEKWLVIKN